MALARRISCSFSIYSSIISFFSRRNLYLSIEWSIRILMSLIRASCCWLLPRILSRCNLASLSSAFFLVISNMSSWIWTMKGLLRVLDDCSWSGSLELKDSQVMVGLSFWSLISVDISSIINIMENVLCRTNECYPSIPIRGYYSIHPQQAFLKNISKPN